VPIPRERAPSRREILQTGTACLAALSVEIAPSVARAAETIAREDLATAFESVGVAGAFVACDAATSRFTLVNAARAEVRYLPASTFKIPNSLIGLEVGAIKGADEMFPYDGKPRRVKAWERDMTLREAINASNVPVYQTIARRVGLANYRDWLVRLDYGNHQPGNVVDTFWLEGPLLISATEQARFLARMALGILPLSKRSIAIVRDMIRIEEKDGRTLFAKTGWDGKIGWWVGWVEEGSRATPFALNMDMTAVEEAPKRIALGKELLGRLGVY
jgi:beta-lactamase class D